ncbi:hypothetical protein N7537_010446 [Penicillium hordei]|uniref:Integrase catalytic domain-containing protein n=1 Tax=Penicillium hordei TaxID=40994 RepID=A0AAD6DUX4_9EURO|nr:uncharacterized protein N7537_010446 [Penicillium hordei]KAJ5593542.1 hypothetical protein N7537_010446 [Penicillium hordei]
MTEIARFEQFGSNTSHNGTPTLDNARDWFRWNQKVNEFIRMSAVADDGATSPIEEDEEARQWIHRQKFYSAMITAKLTDNATQMINAFEISQVQALLQTVKYNFKLEGSGTGHFSSCMHSALNESFRDYIFRQMDLFNERDANGNVTKAAPTFDYIENKAIAEEHRKGQLGKQAMETQALSALALVRKPGDKKLIPSSDGTTCRIEIDNVPYCSFCRKPYHVDSECFAQNPKLKVQKKDGDGPKPRPGRIYTDTRKHSKMRPSTDDEDDDAGGPKDPKKLTFMARKASEKNVNEAFGKGIEGNFALSDYVPIIMAIRTLSIRGAWIVDSGCAQYVCNSASGFVQMTKYHGLSLRGVDTSTAPSGVGTVNILCNSNGKNLFTASEYHRVYALDLWANLTFTSYYVSLQMSLWNNRLAHLSDANLRRLKQQSHGVREMEPRHLCNPCLQGRMIEESHSRLRGSRREEHAMNLLYIDVAGAFDEGLNGSRYWLTIVDDFTSWIELIPIPRRQHFVIESLRFVLDHNERPERKCRRIRLDRISEQVGDEMKFMLFSCAIQAEIAASSQPSDDDSQPIVLYRETGTCRPHEMTTPSDLYHLFIMNLSFGLGQHSVATSNNNQGQFQENGNDFQSSTGQSMKFNKEH